MVPVASSALAEVGYDADSRTLFIRFRAGGLYAYLDVPPEDAAGLMQAPSKGGFFQARIDPRFRFLKLE